MDVFGMKKDGVPVLAMAIQGQGKNIKRIRGAVIDKKGGVAYFPAFYPFVKEIYSDMIKIWPKANFSEKAKEIMLEQKALKDQFFKGKLSTDFKSKTSMYAHQKDSFLSCLAHPRTALFLACGLGKTLVAIQVLRYLKEPALVLLPPTLINNWKDELKTHSYPGEFVIESLDGSAQRKKDLLTKKIDANILLIGYETASKYVESIYDMYDYNVIIADESQKMKSHKAQRTKSSLFLAQKAHRRIIMSGTAVTNAPTDLFSQLKFLSTALVGDNYYRFCNQFVETAKHNKHIIVGYKNLNILNKRVNSVAMRFKKEDCLDLPERMELNRKFYMSKEQETMYNELLNDETLYLPEGAVVKEHKIVILGKLAQVTGGFMNVGQKDPFICDKCPNKMYCVEENINPYTSSCSVVQKAPKPKTIVFSQNPKMDTCRELVEEITAEPTNKVIIWARHIWEIRAIEKMLEEIELPYTSLPDQASKVIPAVTSFDKSTEQRVLISQIARGVGWTANSANYVIYYSLDFNLENYLQSVDRNYRINQNRSVTVYRLVAEHQKMVLIDQHVIDALDAKVDIQETLLKKVECLRCPMYKTCREHNVEPWDPDCILSSRKQKKIISI